MQWTTRHPNTGKSNHSQKMNPRITYKSRQRQELTTSRDNTVHVQLGRSVVTFIIKQTHTYNVVFIIAAQNINTVPVQSSTSLPQQWAKRCQSNTTVCDSSRCGQGQRRPIFCQYSNDRWVTTMLSGYPIVSFCHNNSIWCSHLFVFESTWHTAEMYFLFQITWHKQKCMTFPSHRAISEVCRYWES